MSEVKDILRSLGIMPLNTRVDKETGRKVYYFIRVVNNSELIGTIDINDNEVICKSTIGYMWKEKECIKEYIKSSPVKISCNKREFFKKSKVQYTLCSVIRSNNLPDAINKCTLQVGNAVAEMTRLQKDKSLD